MYLSYFSLEHVMNNVYCLSSYQHVVDLIFPWCAEDPYFYYTDPDAEAIPEDPQPGQEDEVREWSADDVVWRHHSRHECASHGDIFIVLPPFILWFRSFGLVS